MTIEIRNNQVVLSVAQKGQQGVAGAGTSVTAVSGAILSALRAIYTDVTTGKALYADNTNPASVRSLLGITTQAVAIDTNVIVQTAGEITDPSWNWNMAGNVSLFLGTNGAITQGESLSGGAIIARIGYAINPTTILIRMGEPIVTA